MPCAKYRHVPEKNHDEKLQITVNLQNIVTLQRKNVTENYKSHNVKLSLKIMTIFYHTAL